MIHALILAAVIGGAAAQPVLKPCMTSCVNDGRNGEGVRTCWYEMRNSCTRHNPECVESDDLVCKPVSVTIGFVTRTREWDGTSLPPPPPVDNTPTPTFHYNY
jgi:hypothetical protein